MQIRDTYRHKTLDRKTNIKSKAAKVKLRIKMENESSPLTSDSMVFSQALCDRLSTLKSLHQQYIRIEMEYRRDSLALDVGFQKKRQQSFDQRKCIVNGGDTADTRIDHTLSVNSIDQITDAIRNLRLDDDPFVLDNGDSNNKMAKCVPNFWLQALKNCPNDLAFIRDEDNEVLRHLCDIRIGVAMEPESSFTLEFEFQPNRFFHNNILTKRYDFGFSIVKAIGCSIEWKDGMNVMGNTNESFFAFFNAADSMEYDHMDEDSSIPIELQNDFEAGLFIKDRLIPNAVLYYLNAINNQPRAMEISVLRSHM